MEKILSINSGSSSLKFKLFAMPDEKVLAKGLFDRIGIDNSRVTIKYDGKKYDEQSIYNIVSNTSAAKILVQKGIISIIGIHPRSNNMWEINQRHCKDNWNNAR